MALKIIILHRYIITQKLLYKIPALKICSAWFNAKNYIKGYYLQVSWQNGSKIKEAD